MKNILNKAIFLLLAFLIVSCGRLFAQKKRHSNISLHTGGFYCFTNYTTEFKQFNEKRAASIVGIRYSYNFEKGWSGFANFTFTNNHNGFFLSDYIGGDFFTRNDAPLDKKYLFYYPNGDIARFYNPNGQLIDRNEYYFFDLGLIYTYPISRKHQLSVHVGASYAYGINNYITLLNFPPRIPEGEGLVVGDNIQKWVKYWGAVAGVSYNYYFWKGRMNAGATINLRYYGNQMPFFTDYGLHVGYNF